MNTAMRNKWPHLLPHYAVVFAVVEVIVLILKGGV